MMQYHALVRSSAWRRTSRSAVRRFKATLQVEQDERPNQVAPEWQQRLDTHVKQQTEQTAKENAKSQRYQYIASNISKLVSKVKPGNMSAADWGVAKSLVIESCRVNKPKLATDLLYRMIEESKVTSSPRSFVLYGTLYNVVMSAWSRAHKAEEAEKVFYKMLLSHSEHPDTCPAPDRVSYNALLTAWASSKSPIAIDRVLEILHEMEESDSLQPDGYTYNIVMSCYANRVGEYGAAKAAEDILLRFSERHVQGLLQDGPTTLSFNIVMKAWSNSKDEKGPDRALEIFYLMEKLNEEGHEHVKPDAISLLAIMNSFAQKGDFEMAEKLLRESNVEGDMTLCYNCLLTAFAKSGLYDAGDRAEALLADMGADADSTSYAAVLNAHASSNRPDAAHRCEDFLGRTVEGYLKYQTDLRPSKAFFHTVLRAWEAHKDPQEAAERASALVNDMEGLAKEWKLQTKPAESTYSFLIDIMSKIDGHRAENLLQDIIKKKIVPWERSFNVVIASLVSTGSKESVEKGLKVLDLLEKHHPGNTSAYNQILSAMNKLEKDFQYKKRISQELLARMEEGFRKGNQRVRPSLKTYATVLKFLSDDVTDRDAHAAAYIFSKMKAIHVDPDNGASLNLEAHQVMLTVLARAKTKEAADLAVDILLEMLSKDYHTYPDGQCLGNAIIACARAPSSKYTLKAHSLLMQMMQMYQDGKIKHYPYRSSFPIVLFALSRCREKGALEKATALVQIMQEAHDRGATALEPSGSVYSTYFAVMANSLAVENGAKAEELLDEMKDADLDMWNKLLLVWARCRAPDRAAQTHRCFRKMQNTEGAPQPNVYSYNAVLSAAAHSQPSSSEEKQEVLQIATEIFQELQSCESAEPDHVSYGTILKCYKAHMGPSQERLVAVRAVFEACKAEGYVGRLAIGTLEELLTPKDFQEALGDAAQAFHESKSIKVLPTSWTRKTKERTQGRVPFIKK